MTQFAEHYQLVGKLLRAKADVNALDVDDNNALHKVIDASNYEKKDINLVQLFIENGIDINKKNKRNYTPLLLAAKWLSPDVLVTLLDNGVLPNCIYENSMNIIDLIRISFQDFLKVISKTAENNTIEVERWERFSIKDIYLAIAGILEKIAKEIKGLEDINVSNYYISDDYEKAAKYIKKNYKKWLWLKFEKPKVVAEAIVYKESIFNSDNEEEPKTKQRVDVPGLIFTDIPDRNGDCFYYAVGLYLGQSAQTLRDIVASYIENNKDQYQDFVSKEETIDDYIKAIRNEKTWVDYIQIQALMQFLNRPIVIVNSEGAIINKADVKKFNGEPMFVHYDDHNHYNGFILEKGYSARGILQSLMNYAESHLERRSSEYKKNEIDSSNSSSNLNGQNKTNSFNEDQANKNRNVINNSVSFFANPKQKYYDEYFNKGIENYNIGNYSEAICDFEICLEQLDKFRHNSKELEEAKLYTKVAKSYLKLYAYGKAIENYQKVVRLKTESNFDDSLNNYVSSAEKQISLIGQFCKNENKRNCLLQ